MIHLSACIDMLFSDLPMEDRIRMTKSLGIPFIEFWNWNNKDLPMIASTTKELGLGVSALCIGTADADLQKEMAAQGGLLGGKCTAQFVQCVKETIKVAKTLGNPVLIQTSGNTLADVSRQAQHDSLVACLQAAAPFVEQAGFTIVLEPLNELVDHAGIFLTNSDEGFDILRKVASKNVKLLYDIYHQQITQGNIIATIRQNIDWIGHFHTADVPGRKEPGTGELNYQNILSAIAATDYTGAVGIECHLTAAPAIALACMIQSAKDA